MVRYFSLFSIIPRISIYSFLQQGKMDFLKWKPTEEEFGRGQLWVRIPLGNLRASEAATRSLGPSEGSWDWWGETRELGVYLIGVLFLKEACAGISPETEHGIFSLNNHCYF